MEKITLEEGLLYYPEDFKGAQNIEEKHDCLYMTFTNRKSQSILPVVADLRALRSPSAHEDVETTQTGDGVERHALYWYEVVADRNASKYQITRIFDMNGNRLNKVEIPPLSLEERARGAGL